MTRILSNPGKRVLLLFNCLHGIFFFPSFLTDQNLTPSLNKKWVTVMWRKYHVITDPFRANYKCEWEWSVAQERVILPIANYPQFILNRYQEVDQKHAHTAVSKNNLLKFGSPFCGVQVQSLEIKKFFCENIRYLTSRTRVIDEHILYTDVPFLTDLHSHHIFYFVFISVLVYIKFTSSAIYISYKK